MSSNALFKTLAVNLLDAAGVGRLLKPFYGGRGAVLAFHRVLPPDVPSLEPGNVVRVGQLREALRYLVRSGFEIIPLDEIPERLRRNAAASGRFVAITLDDGYADNLLHAGPVFREFRAPFAVFPVTGFLNRTLTYCPAVLAALLLHSGRIVLKHPVRGVVEYSCRTPNEKLEARRRISLEFDCPFLRFSESRQCSLEQSLPAACEASGLSLPEILDGIFLSWEQLRALSRDPLATIGLHTVSHASLAALPEEQAAHEISAAQRELETQLGVPVRHIAYPFGSPDACGEREFRLAREMGFLTGYTTRRGNLHTHHQHALWSLPRHTISMARHSAGVPYLRLSLSGLWDSPLNGTIVRR